MQLQAHGSLANVLWAMGDFVGSREHSEKALVPSRERLPPGEAHMAAACMFFESLCTSALGFPDTGLRRSLKFLAWAQEKAQALPLVFALNCVATVLRIAQTGGRRAQILACFAGAHGKTRLEQLALILPHHPRARARPPGKGARRDRRDRERPRFLRSDRRRDSWLGVFQPCFRLLDGRAASGGVENRR